MSDRYTDGMAVRRAVLGDAHVGAAEARRSAFDEPFQRLITEAAWGQAWADGSLPRQERSLLTIALLAAGGNFDEIPMHIRATANTGASPTGQRILVYGRVRDQRGRGLGGTLVEF